MFITNIEWDRVGVTDETKIAFLGSGRCFHTFDWFRSSELLLDRRVPFITDNYEGDGLPCLIRDGDDVHELLVIDRLLSPNASSGGDRWRNIVKFLLIPIQIFLLRRVLAKLGHPFVIAHSTYYAFLASFAGADYAAVPQGSEVLVRPNSRIYRGLLTRSVGKARFITVDSEAMRTRLREFTDRPVHIVQNGINVRAVQSARQGERTAVMSIRAIAPNYRIMEIVAGRDTADDAPPLILTFPFTEAAYLADVERALRPEDQLLGCLEKPDLYDRMARAICVISVPASDSSPRTVYEAIFAGAAAICAPAQYIDALPACMRSRIVVADPAADGWFGRALAEARRIADAPYQPSAEALDTFDQVNSMGRTLALIANDTVARLRAAA